VKPEPYSILSNSPISSSQYFTKVHAQLRPSRYTPGVRPRLREPPGHRHLKFAGAEIKYAILEGTAATPALAIRGSYTAISGIDILDIKTTRPDISISKGILMVTPYAASDRSDQGQSQGYCEPRRSGRCRVTLQDVSVSETKGFVGARSASCRS